MTRKLSIIYVPFLVIAISYLALYTLFHWLFFLRNNSFRVREDLVDIWLPFGLVWIPVLLWLRPRINLLDMDGRKGSPYFGHQFLAAIAIAVPTIVAQTYIETATGKLTLLNNIHEIDNHRATRFYKIRNDYISRDLSEISYTSDVSGKRNNYLNLHIYIVCPVYNKQEPAETGTIDSEPDTISNPSPEHVKKEQNNAGTVIIAPPANIIVQARVLACFKYGKQISNRISDSAKKETEHQFYNESMADFNQLNFDSIIYFTRMGNNKFRDAFQAAITKNDSVINICNQILLSPEFNAFDKRNGQKLLWTIVSFFIAIIAWLVLILFTRINEIKEKKFLQANGKLVG